MRIRANPRHPICPHPKTAQRRRDLDSSFLGLCSGGACCATTKACFLRTSCSVISTTRCRHLWRLRPMSRHMRQTLPTGSSYIFSRLNISPLHARSLEPQLRKIQFDVLQLVEPVEYAHNLRATFPSRPASLYYRLLTITRWMMYV